MSPKVIDAVGKIGPRKRFLDFAMLAYLLKNSSVGVIFEVLNICFIGFIVANI